MTIKNITQQDRKEFNKVTPHPLQSYEWGEFREKTGVNVIRRGFYENGKIIAGFQLTIHKIPHTSLTIGYLPKGTLPTKEMIDALIKIGNENKCIFIQLEPNVFRSSPNILISQYPNIYPSAHPLFTKYTFQLDLTKSEEELLKNMHPKTRYNIRIAQKHGVMVKEENSDEAFEAYLKLTKATTNRQGFYSHTENYHRKMWKTLQGGRQKGKGESSKNELTAHLLIAYYKNIPVTTWILFVFRDTLYYPYGASSSEYREVMASNLMMWEAIRFGKKLGLKTFDMWGSLGEHPDLKDPWYGFHRFKQGYEPKLVEFVGSYDLVIHPLAYQIYKIADKLRWLLLRLKKQFIL